MPDQIGGQPGPARTRYADKHPGNIRVFANVSEVSDHTVGAGGLNPVTPGFGFAARNRSTHRHEGNPRRRIPERLAPHESPATPQIGTRFNE